MNLRSKQFKYVVLLIVLGLIGCSEPVSTPDPTISIGSTPPVATSDIVLDVDNPFFTDSTEYLDYPPFDRIENRHFLPAFASGIEQQLAEVDAIASQQAAPGFENTIVALELSGQLLNRVASVFSNLAGAHSSDELRALEQHIRPLLTAHDDEILLNQDLFARIKSLYESRRQLPLDPISLRLLERYYQDFVRAGAALDEIERQRMREINTELTLLQTQYNQNILLETNDLAIVVDSEEELAGLNETDIAVAAAAAVEANLPGKYVLQLVNTSNQPVLASLQNRSLRERIHQTSVSRGSRVGVYDNRETLVNVLRLRAERARLLGYENHAAYILAKETAMTVPAVNNRLAELSVAALRNAQSDAVRLQQIISVEDEDMQLAAWDWSYYSEKMRSQISAFDERQMRPYLELNNVLQRGVFFAAEKLYGLSFQERTDLPVYQQDVRVFEVFDAVGTTLGIFIADYYARPSKRGGAWNSAYVIQSDLLGTQPIYANHLNISKPAAGEATLLSIDEVTTLFHEFGHALHGFFSSVDYPYFSGTRVPRDFVEFPSQVNEMWATWPEILANYALHYQTGAVMPQAMQNQVLAVDNFNQGFATTEYLAAAILDQALHQLTLEQIPAASDLLGFEADVLAAANIAMDSIPPRYRSTYFRHIMGNYSAAYYSYIWSEVLDADTVDWFKENGGLRRENGEHFRHTLLAKGGSEDPMELFRNFRGRDPQIEPLLIRRGLN